MYKNLQFVKRTKKEGKFGSNIVRKKEKRQEDQIRLVLIDHIVSVVFNSKYNEKPGKAF